MYFFFFFPVGTDSRSSAPPVGTLLLLAILGTVFSVRFLAPDVYYGLVSASFRPAAPGWGGAVLSLFLHGGWAHLLGNALYLWIFGKQLEGRLGFPYLMALFLLGGVCACWFQAWLTPHDSVYFRAPLIGASGSVAALLGVSLVRFRHQRVRVLYFVFAFLGGMARGGVAHVNTLLACFLWFVLQVTQGLVAWGSGGGAVAYAAHAGGFLTGVMMGLVTGQNRDARRDVHRRKGRRYFENGDWFAAASEFTIHLRHFPKDLEVRAMRARAYVVLGRVGEAANEYLRVFRESRRGHDLETAARLYREMRRYGVGSDLDESGLLRIAYDFRRIGKPEEAAEAFLELATRFPAGPKAELALIRRAELLWSDLGRYEDAQQNYRRFLERYPESEWRETAARRLESMDALTGVRSPRSSPGTSSPRATSFARPGSSS